MNSIKVVFLGDSGVGKSSIVERFINDKFLDYNEATFGASYLTKCLDNIKFNIWDTAGQERYRSFAPMYYRGTSAAIIVYDVTNDTSFESAKSWINEIKEKCKENCIIVLVGNKCDLPLRRIDYKYAVEYANDNNLFFTEASAKKNLNIDNIFKIIANNYDTNTNNEIDNNVRLIPKKKVERKCC